MRFSSDTFTLLALALLLIRARYGYRLRDLFRFKLLYIRRILGIGLMTSAEGICYTTSQVVTTGFLTAYGMVALSTKTYVQNIEYYAYIMGSSLGQAAQILSGHMMGAGETEKAYSYINKIWRYVVSCNILFGTLLYVFSDSVMGFFTSSQEIIELAKPLLAIDIAIHFARSFNHTQSRPSGSRLRFLAYDNCHQFHMDSECRVELCVYRALKMGNYRHLDRSGRR